MLERTAIAIALVLLAVLAYRAWQAAVLRRQRRVAPDTPGLRNWRNGVPGVLYFTAPNCAPCISIQRPALGELAARLGDNVQIITVDVSTDPEVAAHWAVLSLPTTVILDGDATPRDVNPGVAQADQLLRQLRAVGCVPC